MSAFDPLTKPGFVVRRLQQLSVKLFQASVEGFDLTATQYVSLQVIQDQPGIDQVTLSRATDIDSATIVRIVDRLCRQGRVEKRVSMQDRRMNQLFLTAKGGGLLKAASEYAERSQVELLAPLSPEDQEKFMELALRLVAEHTDKAAAAAGSAAPDAA